MEEQPINAVCNKPRGDFQFTLWWRKVTTGEEFMNDLRDRTGKWYISMTAVDTNPGFPKSFPLKQVFQNHLGKDDFLAAPLTSHPTHRLHPFIPTWVYGCCLHSPYTPGIVQLLQKGDQIQPRDYKSCSSEKGIFVFLDIDVCPILYVFRWDENAWENVNIA